MTIHGVRAKVLRLSSTGGIARVAEWQTRTVQVRVSERTWRFNSSLAHSRPSLSGLGLCFVHWGFCLRDALGVEIDMTTTPKRYESLAQAAERWHQHLDAKTVVARRKLRSVVLSQAALPGSG